MSIARRPRSCGPRCVAIPMRSRAGSCSPCSRSVSVTRPGRMTPMHRRAWPRRSGARGATPGERYALAVDAIIRPRGTAAESPRRPGSCTSMADGLLPRGALGGAAVNLIHAYALDEAEAWLERIFDELRELGLPVAWMQASSILGSLPAPARRAAGRRGAAARGVRDGRRDGARLRPNRRRRARHRPGGGGSGRGGRRAAGGLRSAGARPRAHARQRPAASRGRAWPRPSTGTRRRLPDSSSSAAA